MIKHPAKYIYSLVTITVLITLNKIYAQDKFAEITILANNEINSFKEAVTINNIDKNKLNSTIKDAENLLLNAKVGSTDGCYPEEAIDNLKLVIDESKNIYQWEKVTQAEINSQVLKLEKAIAAFENEEICEYLEHKQKLKGEIQSCINILSDSKEGSSIGEYSKKTREDFKKAIAEAEKIAAKSDKNSQLYINALEVLQKAKTIFQSSIISNEDLDKYSKELSVKLDEISKTIKESEVGITNGGISENQKVALSVIYTKIKDMVKDTDNINMYKKAIKLAKNALSDFNDGTISIDEHNNVNGRKLTGVIAKPHSKPTNVTITNKEEFIPKAGIPFDIKLVLNTIGAFFLGIGAIMFRKE